MLWCRSLNILLILFTVSLQDCCVYVMVQICCVYVMVQIIEHSINTAHLLPTRLLCNAMVQIIENSTNTAQCLPTGLPCTCQGADHSNFASTVPCLPTGSLCTVMVQIREQAVVAAEPKQHHQQQQQRQQHQCHPEDNNNGYFQGLKAERLSQSNPVFVFPVLSHLILSYFIYPVVWLTVGAPL